MLSPGIDKCDPTKADWTGYINNCCTTSNPCGENEGGCSSNDQCGGTLICSSSEERCSSIFDTDSGEKCCHLQGENFILRL